MSVKYFTGKATGELEGVKTGRRQAGILVVLNRRLESRMGRMESQIGDLRRQVDTKIGELRERMADLEGLLEGLREAITCRNVA